MAKILIVEDNEGIRHSMQAILSVEDHEIIEADDGRAALDELDLHGPVDLVLTDIIMPDMDGVALIAALADRPNRPRIVICSGGGSRLAAENILEIARHRADGILEKPFRGEELVHIVNSVLDNR